MVTISQIMSPMVSFEVVPISVPNPAPIPERMEWCISFPAVSSIIHAPIAAPAQAPMRVPNRGRGMRNVPAIAPVIEPAIAPNAPREPAPAFFAAPGPAKNSAISPINASAAIAINV